MMYPEEEVQRTVAAAYAVFARYGRPQVMDASPARDGQQMLRTLSAAPLRELSSEAVGPYSGSALFTVGSLADYKHFLPRILDIAVRGGTAWIGLDETITKKMVVSAGGYEAC